MSVGREVNSMLLPRHQGLGVQCRCMTMLWLALGSSVATWRVMASRRRKAAASTIGITVNFWSATLHHDMQMSACPYAARICRRGRLWLRHTHSTTHPGTQPPTRGHTHTRTHPHIHPHTEMREPRVSRMLHRMWWKCLLYRLRLVIHRDGT